MKTMVFVVFTGDLHRRESDRCSILAAVIRGFDFRRLWGGRAILSKGNGRCYQRWNQ